ncbi:hypothetical protein ACI3E1_07585, partial [Ligilactobacillus sp. LYQ139]|uniref:hypothetical protein n=1 Tax=Ligilactobacillus sp. LYQ139 TaxID=3378800 RepID=UPI0038546D44
SLHEDGRVGTDVLKYKGVYRSKLGYERETMIFLLLYLQIIPIIRDAFNSYKNLSNSSDIDDFINTFVSRTRKSLEEIDQSHKINYEN